MMKCHHVELTTFRSYANHSRLQQYGEGYIRNA